MGNRKLRIKTQEIYDELGFGRYHDKNVNFKDQLKPREVIKLYNFYKLNSVYDCFLFSNANIIKWDKPRVIRLSAYNGGHLTRGFPIVIDGMMFLSTGSEIESIDINDKFIEKYYLAGPGPIKPRIEIEKILLSHPRLRPQIRTILESGGHIHDPNGFILPEICNNYKRVWYHDNVFTGHPLLEGTML